MSDRDEICFYKNGKFHRDRGLPAVTILSTKTTKWYINGVLNRENDLPTIIRGDILEWHKDGKLHRDNDKPARVLANGDREYYQNGRLSRANDLPAYVGENFAMWLKDGNEHRENDQPSYICGDYMRWCLNDTLHRDFGRPAVFHCRVMQEWHVNGQMHRDDDLPAAINTITGVVQWATRGKITKTEQYNPAEHFKYFWSTGAHTKAALHFK